jgi:hypothetical protein
MLFRRVSRTALVVLLAGGLLAGARAQNALPGAGGAAAPPRQPQQPQAPQAPTPEQPQPQQQQQQEPNLGAEQAAATGAGGAAVASANVQGDQLGLPALIFLPRTVNGRRTAGAGVAVTHDFKIAEDQNPAPQDRVFVDFNYYNNVNHAVDVAGDVPFRDINVYRETFGFEKTFLDGDASLGLRLPLDTLDASSDLPGLGEDRTAVGDLSVILKGVLCRDCQSGSLLSAGVAATFPTGKRSFAGGDIFTPVHDTILTPYLAYLWKQDQWYVQGFESIDIPTGHDVTLLHSDVQIGYYLLQEKDPDALLSAVIPLFEVHVTDPLDHRGILHTLDPLGTDDFIDLTMGVTLELKHRATLALGVVTPVTGPKPFDVEALVQFNIFFGRGRSGGGQGGNVMAANTAGQ